ncbi:MAG: DUF2891 domain-containing protein [Caulobacteraceae bacterium]
MLTASTAAQWAKIALGHVTREYPNKLDHVLNGPGDLQSPKALHPIFHGSFDWHSCVHGYWLLATLHRLHLRNSALGIRIRALFNAAFTPAKVQGELAYLDRDGGAGFERPYGWAWLMMLHAELERSGSDYEWAERLSPLTKALVLNLRLYLDKLTYPVRAGTHGNSAFALALAHEYAVACGDAELEAAIEGAARRWYLNDADHRPLEPSGEDFLSPALMEADCMRRVLGPLEFPYWFDGFLKEVADLQPASLFEPALVSDRSDGRIAHLDGLNLSRAWCWRGLAEALPSDHPARGAARVAADRHFAAAAPHLAGDYAGEHWLASFALLATREI